MYVPHMLPLLRAMAGAGIDHAFGCYFQFAESLMKFMGLADRYAEILFTVNDQGRCFYPRHMGDGRTFTEICSFFAVNPESEFTELVMDYSRHWSEAVCIAKREEKNCSSGWKNMNM